MTHLPTRHWPDRQSEPRLSEVPGGIREAPSFLDKAAPYLHPPISLNITCEKPLKDQINTDTPLGC